MQNDFIKSNYTSHKYSEDDFLVTTDYGSWSLLSREEYSKLRLKKIDRGTELFEHLHRKGIIIDEDNVDDVVSRYRLWKSFLFKGTSLHIIFSTDSCNHKCRYCHSEAKDDGENNLDTETGKKIVDFTANSNSDKIKFEFQGGEPLLNFDNILSTIQYAEELFSDMDKEVSFSIVSNLSELDESKIPYLKEYDVNISTSLDGPKELHDYNRKYLEGKSSYKTVKENIDKLRTNGIEVNALCTVTRESFNYIEEIIDTYDRLDLQKIWLRPLNKIGYAKEIWEDIGYTAEEFFDFYSKSLDYILDSKSGDLVEITAYYHIKSILESTEPNMTELTSPCGAGISQLLYDHSGNVYTCDEGKVFDEFKLGNVENDTWNDMFDNENLLTLLDLSSKESYICNNCVWKPYCGICHVNIYSDQESIVPKLSKDFRCNLNKLQIKDIFRRLLFKTEESKKLRSWLANNCG